MKHRDRRRNRPGTRQDKRTDIDRPKERILQSFFWCVDNIADFDTSRFRYIPLSEKRKQPRYGK